MNCAICHQPAPNGAMVLHDWHPVEHTDAELEPHRRAVEAAANACVLAVMAELTLAAVR